MLVMRDPYNPTADDIERWAYDGLAMEPVQDWDIIALRDAPFRGLMMRFVRDPECPKRRYFLHALYLAAGDLLRPPQSPDPMRDLELDSMVRDFRASGFRALYTLSERIQAVRIGALQFSYESWCAGGYAKSEETVEPLRPANGG